MAIDFSTARPDGDGMQNPTAPAPVQPSAIVADDRPLPSYDSTYRCGCGLATGRCEVHSAMMKIIQRAYRGDLLDARAFFAVGRYADGFGIAGDNIGDWSAWRDSTVAAVERMYHAAVAYR